MRSLDVTIVIGVMCGAIIGALILGPMAPGEAAGVRAAAESKGPAGVLNRALLRVREASPRAS
jgi:hypothetical protein